MTNSAVRSFVDRCLNGRLSSLVLFSAGAAFLELLIRANVLSAFIVPPPSEVIMSIGRLFREEALLHRLTITASEAGVAGLLIALVGIPVGVLLHQFSILRVSFEPWVAAAAAAPIVLMYPLFLVLFGRSELTLVMISFVSGLPPIILKCVEGLAATRGVHVAVGQSLGLSTYQMLTKILLPAALPTTFVGVRLGLIFALINVVAVEYLINFGGIGQLISELADRYDLAGMYVAVWAAIGVSVLLFALTEWLERWLVPARGT